MTIILKPEQEKILAEAIQAGLVASPEDALEIALEALRDKLAAEAPRLTAEEWIREFRAWVQSHPTDTPLLSDEAISRESIYGDRGL
jgi:hypothetical protein